MKLERFQGGRRLMAGFAIAGGAGLLSTGAGFLFTPEGALRSYLLAFCYWAGLSVSALILLAAFHAAHAKWMVVLRRALEAMASACWLLPLLFLPIAFGMKQLFPWMEPQALPEHVQELVRHKAPYLNAPFFLLRAAFYFGAWIAVAALLRRWSLQQDEAPGDERLTTRQRRLSAGTLPLLGVTITFAAFDWLMSLEPAYASTVFGVYFFSGSFLAALAVLTLCTVLSLSPALPGGLVRGDHLQNLGRLLFAFVCFWAYIAYSQFMLTWIADLPEEVPWYLSRLSPGWRPMALFLFAGHFALPFVALLSGRLKRNAAWLTLVCLWLLVAHFADLYWVAMPAIGRAMPQMRWTDFTAFFGVGGTAAAFALSRLRGRYAVPVGDPYLLESLRYTQP
ncbi:MAG: hypothetical protein HYZ28_11605 [Myxococcales bacterium]|nr:hypothetical protein [Myxococcales bacterium]